MHGTCLSGLAPVPFTHNAHHYPHFNTDISFGDTKYCITALIHTLYLFSRILTTQFIHLCQYYRKLPLKSAKHKIFYSSTIIHKHTQLRINTTMTSLTLNVP
ncbi:AVB_G0023200.mRNA.1.CDS.1 [Saccharomyces cerevisiae]|nr:AVB_G0023200.mRNA.1.CDS.1 [Saccharomyces cerevisiae]CAI7165222.1 AVB_G0023200.mRNA.1.CDS.1 [Saccharomyces cerevisiae]